MEVASASQSATPSIAATSEKAECTMAHGFPSIPAEDTVEVSLTSSATSGMWTDFGREALEKGPWRRTRGVQELFQDFDWMEDGAFR